jgi:hypothetical protein
MHKTQNDKVDSPVLFVGQDIGGVFSMIPAISLTIVRLAFDHTKSDGIL